MSGTLSKSLGLRTLTSTSAGLAFACVNFLACVQVATAVDGANGAWIALLTAGILCTISALFFAELNGLYPSAAAIRVWMGKAIGETFALTATFLYMTTVIWVIAADSFVLAKAVHAGIPAVPGLVWIVLFLGLATLANLRGVKVAGMIQDLTTFTLLGSLAIISIASLAHQGFHIAAPFSFGGAGGSGPLNFLQAVALGVFIYIGFEWITPMAEEATNSRLIPKGMFFGIILVGSGFILFTLAMTNLIPAHLLGQSLVPQLIVGREAFGAFGFWWMLVVSAITAMTTFNGGFVTASRFIYAAGRERSLPPVFSRLNRHLVPDFALLVLFSLTLVLAVVVYLTGAYFVLLYAGAALEGLMYAVAAYCVISLRRREPDRPRPFRIWGGTVVPWVGLVIFTVLGFGAGATDYWSLVFLAVLAILVVYYSVKVVPRIRQKYASSRRRTSRPAVGG